jgi:hypothetical protein
VYPHLLLHGRFLQYDQKAFRRIQRPKQQPTTKKLVGLRILEDHEEKFAVKVGWGLRIAFDAVGVLGNSSKYLRYAAVHT